MLIIGAHLKRISPPIHFYNRALSQRAPALSVEKLEKNEKSRISRVAQFSLGNKAGQQIT